MQYLIVKASTWDMDGRCRIQGFMNGMRALDPEARFSTLLNNFEVHAWEDIVHQFIDPDHPRLAYEWADIFVDLGGFCGGSDPDRIRYLKECREQEIPYVYGAATFRSPEPELVKGVPAVARGAYSAMQYMASAQQEARIGADLAFLVEPKAWNKEQDPAKAFRRSYTTHPTMNPSRMISQIREGSDETEVQLVLRRDREGFIYEPKMHDNIKRICMKPEAMFGLIHTLQEVHTARYSVAVPAVLYDIATYNYAQYKAPFRDLERLRYLDWEEMHELAMVTPKLVEEVLSAS
jgi:hypothetical protein